MSVSGGLTRTYSYDNAATRPGWDSYVHLQRRRPHDQRDEGERHNDVRAQRAWAAGQEDDLRPSEYFVYDEAGHLVGEYDNSGNLIEETVWFGDTPVATLRPNGGGLNLFYVHTDHLNTPRRVSRPSDNVVVWRWDSDPFGTTAANEDPDGDSNPFVYGLRFPGSIFDAETGLHYNYLRDGAHAATGRYMQSDPLLQPNRFLTDEWAFFVPRLSRRHDGCIHIPT